MFVSKQEETDNKVVTRTDVEGVKIELHQLFRDGTLLESYCIKVVRFKENKRIWKKTTKSRTQLVYSTKVGKLRLLGLYS